MRFYIFGILGACWVAVTLSAPKADRAEAICDGKDLSDELKVLCDSLAEQKNETIKRERELVYPKCKGILDEDIRELCIQLEIAKGTQAVNLTQVEERFDDIPPALRRNNSRVTKRPTVGDRTRATTEASVPVRTDGPIATTTSGKLLDGQVLGGLLGDDALNSLTQQLQNSGIITSLQTTANDALNAFNNLGTDQLVNQFSDFLRGNGFDVSRSALSDVNPDQLSNFVESIGGTKLVDYLGGADANEILNAGVKMIEIWRANRFAASKLEEAQPLQQVAERLGTSGINTRTESMLALANDPLGVSTSTVKPTVLDEPIQLGKMKLGTLNKLIGNEIKNQGYLQKLQGLWNNAFSGN